MFFQRSTNEGWIFKTATVKLIFLLYFIQVCIPPPALWEEQRSLLQCVTLVEPSKSVLVLPGQVMQWFWPNSGW